MDESRLKGLTDEMLSELPTIIDNIDERSTIERSIRDTLATIDNRGPQTLVHQLAAHPATRRWMHEHDEDVFRGFQLAGVSLSSVGLYYVCPQEDQDIVLLGIPERPPLCPNHHVPMIRQPG